MKNTIYYFSGTGNSLYIAKQIQERLGDTELIKITAEVRDNPGTIDANLLGFVFPVYAWGPPIIMKEFLKRITIRKPDYLFAVATCGGGPGKTLKRFEKMLTRKGLALDSAFSVTMPGNDIARFKPPSGAEVRKKLTKTTAPQLADLLLKIAGRTKTAVPEGKFPYTFFSTVVYPFLPMVARKQTKKFSAADTCTGCRTCEKVCPVGNITFNGSKKPVWQERCESCFACIHWCPQQAIELGTASRDKNRYHHPEIRVSELISK
jgi:ferredoxin/flavodoxin